MGKTVRDLQSRFPDHDIIVTVFDEDHNGDYLLEDNPELAEYIVTDICGIDDGFRPVLRCRC